MTAGKLRALATSDSIPASARVVFLYEDSDGKITEIVPCEKHSDWGVRNESGKPTSEEPPTLTLVFRQGCCKQPNKKVIRIGGVRPAVKSED